MDTQAQAFVQRTQGNAQDLAIAIETAVELRSIYYDRTYGDSGAKEITDADLVDYGITAAQLASYITLCEQLANLRDNLAVTQGDYGATINQVRRL